MYTLKKETGKKSTEHQWWYLGLDSSTRDNFFLCTVHAFSTFPLLNFCNFYERSITIYFLLMNSKQYMIESHFILCFLVSGKLLSIAVAG